MEALGPALSAGISLLGGLFGNMAQKKREEQARAADAVKSGYGAQSQAYGNMAQGTNTALQSLMDSYKSALQRPQF